MKVLLFDNKNECPLWWINFLTDLIDNYPGGWHGWQDTNSVAQEELINNSLQSCRGKFSMTFCEKGFAIRWLEFESEAHFNWFVLRWS